MKDSIIIHPKTKEEWQEWLSKNHLTEKGVWVISYNKKSGHPTLSWSDGVDVALCYGWIDSKKVKVDEFSSKQYYGKRKAKSTWSKINKEKVERFIEQGLMTEAGLRSIEIAKENGSWTLLDAVEALQIPEDFDQILTQYPFARTHFDQLSKSRKKMVLSTLLFAKRPETRMKRMMDFVNEAKSTTR